MARELETGETVFDLIREAPCTLRGLSEDGSAYKLRNPAFQVPDWATHRYFVREATAQERDRFNSEKQAAT